MDLSRIIVGCMRISDRDAKSVLELIDTAMENGVNYFDHADIYGGGNSEIIFSKALKNNSNIKREDIILQSKCGIRPGVCYDMSKDYIINSVDGILERLDTDYLDVLLLHRPDALVEPLEVAEAFDELYKNGKVRTFGVSNHKPMQIELLKKYVRQPLIYNQLQYSVAVSNMVANGLEVNMTTEGSLDRDGSVLDYCRLNDIIIQAWSPFQMPDWQGSFVDSEKYTELNRVLYELAEKYSVTPTAIAGAWILRHPANMQVVTGTTNSYRLKDIIKAREVNLTREEWYRLYLAAGHMLP